MKKCEEWHINALWGKIAMVSWGIPSSPPALMVHGFMDSAATFTLLAEQLLDAFYYVAVDLPGHGKSDPLPPGPHLHQGHMIEVIRIIVEYMKWQSFVFIGHSYGAFTGCLYHAIYPGVISKIICLDPLPSFKPYYQVNHQPDIWFKRYQLYYESNFGKLASDNPKLYSYNDIVEMVGNNRQLSKHQAEVVLSRSLVEAGDGMYRLSWEPRVKSMASLPLSEDIILYIMYNNTPPILITIASVDENEENVKKFTSKLIDTCHRLKNCSIVNVIGHHDVHITKPKLMAAHINEFLKLEFSNHSKL